MAPKPKCSAGSRKTIRWFCSSWNLFPFCHSEPHGGPLTRRGRARNLLLKAFQESQKIAPFLKRRTGRSYVHVTPHALCLVVALFATASLSAASVQGSFQRTFQVSGPVDLEVLTR